MTFQGIRLHLLPFKQKSDKKFAPDESENNGKSKKIYPLSGIKNKSNNVEDEAELKR